MKHTQWMAALLTATLLTACTEPDGSPGRGIMNGGALNKQDVGTAAGVVGGALIGGAFGGGAGQVVAAVGGGLLGGWLGNTIGKSLDDEDRAAYNRASQRAMESGEARTWRNSETGRHGTITPRKAYRDSQGRYCRKYTQTIYVDGKAHSGQGTACRQGDGTWQIVN